MDYTICPRCGAENPPEALNCATCHINLEFALENPSEVEKLVQEETRRGVPFGDRLGMEGLSTSNIKDEPVLRPILLLFGSFVFAFILGETVHELGHFLTHRLYGYEAGLVLDPFGGSHTLGSDSPREIWGVTTVAGPLLNLLIAMALFLLLWRRRRPMLLPLLLWFPLALVQEGINFSLGSLTPGGDFELIVNWGVPAPLLLALGILFLAFGIVLLCMLLPLVSLIPTDSFGRKIAIVVGGMASYMFVRFLFISLTSPDHAQEQVIPLIFSLLLATIVVLLFNPLYQLLNRISESESASVTWPEVVVSLVLGLGIVIFQLVTFN